MNLRYRRRQPQERETFQVPINIRKGPPPGPEILPWYWHPDREGAQPPPDAFKAKLAEVAPDVRVCFSPVHERWLIWMKSPSSKNTLCTGWKLLYLWEHPISHEFLPLNELVFHNLFMIDRDRWPNGEAYYDRIQAEVEKEKEARRKVATNERQDKQALLRDGTKISSAAPGNRSALHHDGTIIPSPGEHAWLQQTRKWRLPSEVIQHGKDEKEKQFYGR